MNAILSGAEFEAAWTEFMADKGHGPDGRTTRQCLYDALTAALSIRQGGVKVWEDCCPDCGGRTKAYIERADGSRDGRVRCVECKAVFALPPAQEIADKPSAVSVGDDSCVMQIVVTKATAEWLKNQAAEQELTDADAWQVASTIVDETACLGAVGGVADFLKTVIDAPHPEKMHAPHLSKDNRAQLAFALIDNLKRKATALKAAQEGK